MVSTFDEWFCFRNSLQFVVDKSFSVRKLLLTSKKWNIFIEIQKWDRQCPTLIAYLNDQIEEMIANRALDSLVYGIRVGFCGWLSVASVFISLFFSLSFYVFVLSVCWCFFHVALCLRAPRSSLSGKRRRCVCEYEWLGVWNLMKVERFRVLVYWSLLPRSVRLFCRT